MFSALMFIFLLFVLSYVFRLVVRLCPRHRRKSICSFYLIQMKLNNVMKMLFGNSNRPDPLNKAFILLLTEPWTAGEKAKESEAVWGVESWTLQFAVSPGECYGPRNSETKIHQLRFGIYSWISQNRFSYFRNSSHTNT